MHKRVVQPAAHTTGSTCARRYALRCYVCMRSSQDTSDTQESNLLLAVVSAMICPIDLAVSWLLFLKKLVRAPVDGNAFLETMCSM
eukprot:1505408-Amphidinium_carterae.1